MAGAETTGTMIESAPAERVEFMFDRLQEAFLKIGYLHDTNPDHIMFAYRRFLGRAQLEERDVRILLALARQVEWYGNGGWQVMAERRRNGTTIDASDKAESESNR